MTKTAIGQDSHAFEPEGSLKQLILGGVTIPGCVGLAGNSDADVILHALTNAISGISSVNILGEISDEMCLKQGITDSRAYLHKVIDTLKGDVITHVSITMEGRRPKMAPHILAIKQTIANLVGISLADVGFTATSGEGLTAFGKGEGIMVFVVITTESSPL